MSAPPESSLPRTPFAWLPFLWARVLFPAGPAAATAVRPWSLAVVVLLPAVLLWPCRGFELFEPDEGRYAQIALEMARTGSWLVPTLQGEPYLDKPPLFYWLVKLAYLALGPTPAAARVVPAACVQLTILAVYLIGRRGVGERGALCAAMLLTVAPGFTSVARLLLLDGLLTLCVTLSLLCGCESVRAGRFRWGWWLAAAVASGLGFLTKGPISEVLLFPPLMLAGRLSRSTARVGVRAAASFALVVVLVNLPWYVGMGLRQPAFLSHFFWEHNVMRFAQPFDHLEPVWYYVPILAGGFLPGVLAGVLYLRGFARADGATARSQAGGFWLLAGGWCVLFFSCAGSKLPTYILPAFPPLALALGEYLARSGWAASKGVRGTGVLCVFIMAGLHYAFVPWYAAERSPLRNPGLVLPYVLDPAVPVVTSPRHVDSVAVAAGRADFVLVRSKDVNQLIVDCHFRPRTVVLFTHDHSFAEFAALLPPGLRVTDHVDYRRKTRAAAVAGLTPWGLCDLAVVEPLRVQAR